MESISSGGNLMYNGGDMEHVIPWEEAIVLKRQADATALANAEMYAKLAVDERLSPESRETAEKICEQWKRIYLGIEK